MKETAMENLQKKDIQKLKNVTFTGVIHVSRVLRGYCIETYSNEILFRY